MVERSRTPRKRIKKPAKIIELGNRPKFTCEFCENSFSRQKTLLFHLCEQKRRFQQKDELYARYGFYAFSMLQKNCLRTLPCTEKEFRTSEVYLALVKWGHFIQNIQCLDFKKYLQWLVGLKVPVDKWDKDEIYDCWIQAYVFQENVWASFQRSLETMTNWGEESNSPMEEYFLRAGNARILTDVQRGRITGWIIFLSETGKKWLQNLPNGDMKLVWNWINPERWKLELEKYPLEVKEIQLALEKEKI
ncbi:Uncharacterised protein [uncultured archaeon]|nr:Uncharacterised protein [uncultured archaeon]